MGGTNTYATGGAAVIGTQQAARLTDSTNRGILPIVASLQQAQESAEYLFSVAETSLYRLSPYYSTIGQMFQGTGQSDCPAGRQVNGTATAYLTEVSVGDVIIVPFDATAMSAILGGLAGFAASGGSILAAVVGLIAGLSLGSTNPSAMVSNVVSNTELWTSSELFPFTGSGGVKDYIIVKKGSPALPILHHPLYYFNNTDTLGLLFTQVYEELAASAINILDDDWIPDITDLETYIQAHIDMASEIVTRMVEMSQRATDAGIDATISTYLLPIIDAIEAKRVLELADFSRLNTAANGFFNSNLPSRVTEINNRFDQIIADTSSKVGMEFRNNINEQALKANQIMAGYENTPMKMQIMEWRARAEIMQSVYAVRNSTWMDADRALVVGYGYGTDQTKRDMANDAMVLHSKGDPIRWEAEIMQMYSAVGGAGAGKGANVGSILSGALGGAATGAGIGTAITPGIGTGIGAAAGALLGGVSGMF